jgi:hypothetical protein
MSNGEGAPVTTINLADGFGSLRVDMEGYAYPHDTRYLRGQVSVSTRYFQAAYPSDFEWQELLAFGRFCAGMNGPSAPPLALYDPKAEKYVRMRGELTRSGRVNWVVRCTPALARAEWLEFPITTDRQVFEAMSASIELACRRWPQQR